MGGDYRGRLTVQPLGTDMMLRRIMPADWHHTRRAYDWIGEIQWGEKRAFGASWLIRDKRTGIYMELRSDLRGVSNLPQHKVAAAIEEAGIVPSA